MGVPKLLKCWSSFLDSMQETHSDMAKRDLLYRRMVSSVVSKEELTRFRQEKAKGEGADNYTPSYLHKSIERLIANDRQDKNLADRENALRQAASGKAVAELATWS